MSISQGILMFQLFEIVKRTGARLAECLSVGPGSSHDPAISELSNPHDAEPGSLPWTAGSKSLWVFIFRQFA